MFATPIATRIWNDRFDSGIRLGASRAARFARSRATLVPNRIKQIGGSARASRAARFAGANVHKAIQTEPKELPKGAKREPTGEQNDLIMDA